MWKVRPTLAEIRRNMENYQLKLSFLNNGRWYALSLLDKYQTISLLMFTHVVYLY